MQGMLLAEPKGGTFESPITEAGNTWIQENDGSGKVLSLTGISQSELNQYVSNGVPNGSMGYNQLRETCLCGLF